MKIIRLDACSRPAGIYCQPGLLDIGLGYAILADGMHCFGVIQEQIAAIPI
jgi:hypothetical protein